MEGLRSIVPGIMESFAKAGRRDSRRGPKAQQIGLSVFLPWGYSTGFRVYL